MPNRYTFQGREWDAHRQDYYYRNRIYVPEWGSFTGPDMNLANGILGEPNGMMSYVAFGNNPLVFRDPMGLADTFLGRTLQYVNLVSWASKGHRLAAELATEVAWKHPTLGRPMASMAFAQNFTANLYEHIDISEMGEGIGKTTSARITTREIEYGLPTGEAVYQTLNQTALDINPFGQIIQGVYGKSLEPWNPQERLPASERASRISGGVGGTAGLAAWGLMRFGPTPLPQGLSSAQLADLKKTGYTPANMGQLNPAQLRALAQKTGTEYAIVQHRGTGQLLVVKGVNPKLLPSGSAGRVYLPKPTSAYEFVAHVHPEQFKSLTRFSGDFESMARGMSPGQVSSQLEYIIEPSGDMFLKIQPGGNVILPR